MTIGERIKKRRQQLGLSVDQVAEALNKNRATVYRYESSYIEKMPTTVLEPLSKVLKTTPAYLMGWTEEEPPTHREDAITDIIIRLRKDEKFLNLVETLKEYPEERIDAISAMISAFEK